MHFSQISAFVPNTQICVTTTLFPLVATFMIFNIPLICNEVVLREIKLHKLIYKRCKRPWFVCWISINVVSRCISILEMSNGGYQTSSFQSHWFWSHYTRYWYPKFNKSCRIDTWQLPFQTVCDEARNSICSEKHGNDYKYLAAFDVIVLDPSYSKRGGINNDSMNPANNHASLVDLFTAIWHNLEAGTPLWKKWTKKLRRIWWQWPSWINFQMTIWYDVSSLDFLRWVNKH